MLPLLLAAANCGQRGADSSVVGSSKSTPTNASPLAGGRAPNEFGRVPVLEYHIVGGNAALFTRTAEQFRQDLTLLYERGYRPVSVSDLVQKKLDLPAGLSPVVFTFDDASPGQFRWLVRGSTRVLDDTSAMGIWRAFQRSHNDWPSRATFCLLSGAKAGHAFFGEKGIQGQLSEWRFEKVRELAKDGFELCGHTLWHARLDRYSDAEVQEQIARGTLAIDSAVPGYRVRSFALPLGVWPKTRALAARGAWTDPKSRRTVEYAFDAVLMVAGGPARSPHDSTFDPHRITRTIVTGSALRVLLDRLDATGERYVSDGDPKTVTRATRIAGTGSVANSVSSARSPRIARSGKPAR